jgi:hypothetical protein
MKQTVTAGTTTLLLVGKCTLEFPFAVCHKSRRPPQTAQAKHQRCFSTPDSTVVVRQEDDRAVVSSRGRLGAHFLSRFSTLAECNVGPPGNQPAGCKSDCAREAADTRSTAATSSFTRSRLTAHGQPAVVPAKSLKEVASGGIRYRTS